MSNTRPIPGNKPDIAVATAMAGEMLGLKSLYLEAGSGAEHPVNPAMIRAVRKNTSLPMMVGGGIRSADTALELFNAGADMIVVGNVMEKDPTLLKAFCTIRDSLNSA